MTKEKNNPENAGCLFEPKLAVFGKNEDALDIVGWCRQSLATTGFELVISIGKRQIRQPLRDISMLQDFEVNPLRCEQVSGDLFFFKTTIKIGKGIKRVRFELAGTNGECFSLGSRLIHQKNKIESAPPRDVKIARKEYNPHEKWLLNAEPKLRSANDFRPDQLAFPSSLLWVVDVTLGSFETILKTLLSANSAESGETRFLLIDSIDVFKRSDWKGYREAFEATGKIDICAPEDLNKAISQLDPDHWLGFLKEGDLVESRFGQDFSRYVFENPETLLFYCDSDLILSDGSFGEPHISPAWNRDLLHSYPYIGDTFLMRKSAFMSAGGFGNEAFLSKWALQLRFSQKCSRDQIGRLCGIYFHLREKLNPNISKEASDEGTRILEKHLSATGLSGAVSLAPGCGGWRIQYSLPNELPKVSLLIPTRDAVSVLKTTVDSILEKTEYPNFEILILDNDSEKPETFKYFEQIERRGCRIISCPGPFNYSQINNRGTMEASGEILGFLNNDLEVIDGGWLTEMVRHVCREDVGAVGAKLLYPDKSLQHAGVLIGVGHVAAHAFRLFENAPEKGPLRAHLVQNYSAVTAACLLVRSEIFRKVGGFDDVNLAITNNDVDLCIKIREAGYRNVYTPYALLFHHESATRGPENTPEKLNRYQKEVNYMWKQWSGILMNDPAYNRLLTRFKEDFSLAGSEELDHYIPGKIF